MTVKNIDLLALSESRWQGHGITQIQSCTILHSGSDSSHIRGVAIALSPHARSSWEAAGSVFKPINDRIMYIRLKSHLSYTTVYAVYAPTNPVSSTSEANQSSEDFYHELHSVLATIPPTDMIVVLGDFNAHVGTDTNTWHTVLGPHGVGQVNGNGQRLLDFCDTNKLLINTWYRHKSKHQCTWYRNGDRSNPGHMIDYVLISAKYRSSILDTRVYRGVHHQSDHELVVSTLRFKIKAKRRRCHHTPPRQTKYLPRDIVSTFHLSLADAYNSHHTTPVSPSPSSLDDNDVWSSFKVALQDASAQLPFLPRQKEADWITDEVKNLSRRKKEAWLRLRDTSSSDDDGRSIALAEYRRFRRLTKVAAEKARNAWWSAKAVEAENKAKLSQQLGRGGSLIKDLRLLKNQTFKPSSSNLLAKDKSILSSDTDKLQRWAEHFADVSNCCTSVSQFDPEALPDITAATPSYRFQFPDDEDLSQPITEEEIQEAVGQLRDGRAPGADGISAELLKLGGAETIRWLNSLFNSIWNSESIPSDWLNHLIIPLHKKGSRSECDNYRGIALLSIPSKVFARILLNRIKPRAEVLLRENQCGFRKGRGCTDQLFSLRVLMEKAREYHHPVYICFVDLRKVYDSVHRSTLWSVLEHCYHLPPKFLTIIKALHENTSAAVRPYGKTSDQFPVSVGIKQGCVLAPTLFNLFFDTVVWLAMSDHHPGAGLSLSYLLDANLVGNRKKLTSEISVSDLEYADDMALISDSYDGLTTLLESLDSKCRHMGLTIKCKKTKLLAVLPDADAQPPAPILLHAESDPIEVVPSFQYLGSIVTSDCTSDAEISSRITKASHSFGSLSRILWHQKKIKRDTKLCIFDSVVLSTLLYGLETAVLLEPQIHCLQSFVMRCLRSILGVSLWDGQRDTSIRKFIRLQRISTMLTQRRLRLLGHITRMNEDRLPRKLLVCAPSQGRRSAGGQRMRWNDQVMRDLRSCNLEDNWRTLAQERSEWRRKIWSETNHLNVTKEAEEKYRKDEQKRRREARQATSDLALRCTEKGCVFTVLNHPGLVNHQRQKHGPSSTGHCQFCHQSFSRQGLHNHERFCIQRTTTTPTQLQ